MENEMNTYALGKDLIDIKAYANSRHVTYEAVRVKIKRYQNDPELIGHIQKVGNKNYLDPEAVKFLDSKQRTQTIVVESGENIEQIKALEAELEEVKADRDEQRKLKDVYMEKNNKLLEKLMEYKENPEKAIDTTRYMLIEDHEKIEKELEEKTKLVSELSEKNKELNVEITTLNDIKEKSLELSKEIKREKEKNNNIQRELSDITVKKNEFESENKVQKQEIDSLQEQIKEKDVQNEQISRELSDTKKIAEEESIRMQKELEEAQREAERKYEEALNMGPFARLKKKKELKKNKTQ